MTDPTASNAPEPTPTPAASPYVNATPAASPYVTPAAAVSPTKRPGTATAGIVILSIQAVLSIIVGFVLLGTLGSVSAGTDGLAQAQLLSGVILGSGIINAVALVFIARGYGVARFVVLVAGGIAVVLDLVSLQPTLGDFLFIGAIVLLFLPKSSAWFRAKAAERAAR